MNPIYQCIHKILPQTIFHTEIKGHNPGDNRWILSLIELNLYFNILYINVLKRHRPETNFYGHQGQ